MSGRIAVLASGGLDSSVMLADLARKGHDVYPLYLRSGLHWEKNELAALRKFLGRINATGVRPVEVLEMPMADVAVRHWSVTGRNVPGYRAAIDSNYILGRNLSLLSKAALFCAHHRIGAVALAPLGDNPFPDARPEFFRALAHAVELATGLRLRIVAPYARMTKAQVIRRGAGLPLELTLSCARPTGLVHCGGCTKCAERIESFRLAGVPDPTRYAVTPPGR